MLLPAARTAMDKKSGKALEGYIQKVRRALSKRTPWRATHGGKLSHLRDRIPSGQTRVLLGTGEQINQDNPLFKDVKAIRE